MQRKTEDRMLVMDRLIWQFGRPADIWLRNRIFIGELIDELGLAPLEPEYLETAQPFVFSRAVLEEKGIEGFPWPVPFPGGLRIPHLHHKREVYALEPEQWERFSTTMVERLRDKLGKARSVDFETLIDISEAVGPIQK